MYALSKLKCTFGCENDISTISAASGEEYTYISDENGSLSVLLFFVCVCVFVYFCITVRFTQKLSNINHTVRIWNSQIISKAHRNMNQYCDGVPKYLLQINYLMRSHHVTMRCFKGKGSRISID